MSIKNPLFVLKLLQCILDCVATPAIHNLNGLVPDAEGRRALAALARTCRAFSEPSLDTLWRQLDSLAPLLRCCGIQLPLQETPPSPAQRTIIDRYSHRILRLTLRLGTWDSLSERFLQLTSSEPFFLPPNLRMLSWEYCDQTRYGGTMSVPLIYIRGLLSPKLTSLDVTSPGKKQESSLAPFFDTFSRLCPDLKSIRFSFDEGPRRVPVAAAHVLSRSICNYASLKSLELFVPIDGASVRHIASISTLETLSLTLDPQIIQPHEISFSAMEAPFHSVQKLGFMTWDFHLVTCLLRNVNQTFHTLGLHLYDQPTPESVSGFFTRLITLKLSHMDTLRSFRFIHYQEPPHLLPVSPYLSNAEGPLNHCFSHDIFSPLTSFISLRELAIDHHQTSLDDNELADLARGWPLLEVLRLDCLPGEYRRPVAKSVTLNGLLSLLTSCPKLHWFSLSLDARKAPVKAGAVVRNSTVKIPQLNNSLIDCPRWVAEFLFEHFPNVFYVDARFTLNLPGDSDYHKQLLQESWKQVNSFLTRRR